MDSLKEKNILGNWYDYKTDEPGKTYYNVLFSNHNYPYSITKSGRLFRGSGSTVALKNIAFIN